MILDIALTGALLTFFASAFATLVNYFRERSEKQKWKRTLDIEERRIKHEENRWSLELNSQREMELYKIRLRTYPEVFALLEKLSHYHIEQFDEKYLKDIAEQLNRFGYGDVGLCMLADTHETVFDLRRHIEKYLRQEITVKELLRGPRNDLIELMRRDLNHSWSVWQDIKPLMDINIQDMAKQQQNQDLTNCEQFAHAQRRSTTG